MSLRIVAITVLLVATASALAIADDANEAEARGHEFFERRIRPLLARHCYECHGDQLQENELRLDRGRDLFNGGVSGKVLVPGKPDQSLLIVAVRHTNDDLKMPPTEKLAAAEIADLVRWVEMGAPHPTAKVVKTADEPADFEARREHWSLQPITNPPLPPVSDSDWCRSSIDHFILARLEAEGLAPVRSADRRTLIRRATFDLTGLPPTPEEIDAFLNDDSPQAFARVVDRLLASPRYGERWGRHWLDVVRYADSNGLDENIAHGNAWRYRDWVIDAFNNDLPIDAFLRMQIAGDLLPAEAPQQRNQNLIATGFLSLGPKVLAEVDERKMEADIIDEQIDTLGRAVLGLTFGCARCHDHKFDPISQRDYYALAGVFQSTHTMDSFKKIASWHENDLHDKAYELAKAEHTSKLAAKQAELEASVQTATAALQDRLGQGAALPAKPEESFPEQTREALKALREEITAIEKGAPQPPTAMGVREGEPIDTAIHLRGSHLTLGEVVPRGVPRGFLGEQPLVPASDRSGRLALADWLVGDNNPLTARVMVNRVWRWHFGRGLVETTDNFGRTGGRPSHAELLGHLASDFRQDWSLKRLHRKLMLSASYQLSSRASDSLIAADPENRLLGWFSPRRLEAEEIRDSMLFVSGTLDFNGGGSTLSVENRKFLFDHTSKDETSYANHRRSVYLPVVRNHLYETFTLFDYTDASVPTGNRPTSTVASQALFLLNSDFMADASRQLAERVEKLANTDSDGNIELLYQLAYGRSATDAEAARAKAFLAEVAQATSDQRAFELLCQNVLISNEFFYID